MVINQLVSADCCSDGALSQNSRLSPILGLAIYLALNTDMIWCIYVNKHGEMTKPLFWVALSSGGVHCSV